MMWGRRRRYTSSSSRSPATYSQTSSAGPTRYLLGIDFGSSFTSISYLILYSKINPTEVLGEEFNAITFCPDTEQPDNAQRQVPSELYYDGDGPGKHVVCWGYEARDAVRKAIARGVPRKEIEQRRIRHPKLLLNRNDATKEERRALRKKLSFLKKKEDDIFIDYFGCLLAHVKEQLEERHDFDDLCEVEFILCVPPIWNPEQSSVMTRTFSAAVNEVGFKGRVRDSSQGEDADSSNTINNLFMVSEPEAATAYFMSNKGWHSGIENGMTIIVLDMGGATVDYILSSIKHIAPLRFNPVPCHEGGRFSGSTRLDENFRKWSWKKMMLQANGPNGIRNVSEIIEGLLMPLFEQRKKYMKLDSGSRFKIWNFPAAGIQADRSQSGVHNGSLDMTFEDVNAIFDETREEVLGLITDALDQARELDGVDPVSKLICMGGFAGSPIMKAAIIEHLRQPRGSYGTVTPIFPTRDTDISVSQGCIIRYLNPAFSPRRETRSSYGMLQRVPYDRSGKIYPAHKGLSREYVQRDDLDGIEYVVGITWKIVKGIVLEPNHPAFEEEMHHTFQNTQSDVRCQEELYVSEECTESHYPLNHPKNEGKYRLAGKFVIDVSYLRDENRVKRVKPNRGHGQPHIRVEYKMVLRVIDRNLFWNVTLIDRDEELAQGRGTLSLVPAFLPGTY